MSIKRITSEKFEFKQTILIGGILLWLLSGYILYAFFQLYREVFRFFTSQHGDQTLLVLSPTENYSFNLFYAAIASALGYSLALRFSLQNSVLRSDWKKRWIIRRTLNTEGFWTWSFLLWFGKVGSMLGIWYLIFAMQYDIDFLNEFLILLILIPLVIFYSTWPDFSRLVRFNKKVWFLRITTIFILMSFGLAFKNFTDYEKINRTLLSNSIYHAFDLEIPKSESHHRVWKRSLIIDFYLVNDTSKADIQPIIFKDNVKNKILISELPEIVREEKMKLSEYERDQVIANLHIDSRIQMKFVKLILNKFRKMGLVKIQFSTGRKHSHYPSTYPAFKNSGIQKTLYPKYYPEFKKFLDSVEHVDLSGKEFKLSVSEMYRNGIIKKYNRVEVNVFNDAISLNGQEINSLNLEKKIYGFIKKYSPNYIIIFNFDEEISYEKYIEIMDVLWTQVDRLRNEMSLDLYQKPFGHWSWEPQLDSIESKFPRNILEWSPEEERLNKLIEKTSIQ